METPMPVDATERFLSPTHTNRAAATRTADNEGSRKVILKKTLKLLHDSVIKIVRHERESLFHIQATV